MYLNCWTVKVIWTARELLPSSAMNANRTVAKRKLEKNPLCLSLKFSGCFWRWLSLKIDLMFLCCEPIVCTHCFFDLKNRANKIQAKRLHSNSVERNVNMISTNATNRFESQGSKMFQPYEFYCTLSAKSRKNLSQRNSWAPVPLW